MPTVLVGTNEKSTSDKFIAYTGVLLFLSKNNITEFQLTKLSNEQQQILNLTDNEFDLYNSNTAEIEKTLTAVSNYVLQIEDRSKLDYESLIRQFGVNVDSNAISAFLKLRDYNASLQKN